MQSLSGRALTLSKPLFFYKTESPALETYPYSLLSMDSLPPEVVALIISHARVSTQHIFVCKQWMTLIIAEPSLIAWHVAQCTSYDAHRLSFCYPLLTFRQRISLQNYVMVSSLQPMKRQFTMTWPEVINHVEMNPGTMRDVIRVGGMSRLMFILWCPTTYHQYLFDKYEQYRQYVKDMVRVPWYELCTKVTVICAVHSHSRIAFANVDHYTPCSYCADAYSAIAAEHQRMHAVYMSMPIDQLYAWGRCVDHPC
jgi:hypothetical protein